METYEVQDNQLVVNMEPPTTHLTMEHIDAEILLAQQNLNLWLARKNQAQVFGVVTEDELEAVAEPAVDIAVE